MYILIEFLKTSSSRCSFFIENEPNVYVPGNNRHDFPCLFLRYRGMVFLFRSRKYFFGCLILKLDVFNEKTFPKAIDIHVYMHFIQYKLKLYA